ncbi:MAG: hypothetical protein ACE5EX_03435, partial [Phycisphaerae bacterium]
IIFRRQRDQLDSLAIQQTTMIAENARLRTEVDALGVRLAGMLAAVQDLEELVRSGTACVQDVANVGASH